MAKLKQLIKAQNLDSKQTNKKHLFLSLVCNILQLCFIYDKDFHLFHFNFLIFVQVSQFMYLSEPKQDRFSSQNETTNNKNDQSNKINN